MAAESPAVVYSRAVTRDMANSSDTFLEQLPLIERIIRSICRERGMNHAETEEFAAVVKLRLIEQNYAIIDKFKGRSSFGTFITTVISRFLNDYRDHLWGKWRNSAVAKRMGAMAMDLERVLVRDGRSFDDAFIELASEYPGTTRKALEEIAVRFPTRHRPRFTAMDAETQAAASAPADAADTETASRISTIVSDFIASLPEEDQLIFQFHFEDAVSIPRIAQSMHLDPQSVYRRLRKHLDDLRLALEKEGISDADASAIAGERGRLLDFSFKNQRRGPSNDSEETDEGTREGAE